LIVSLSWNLLRDEVSAEFFSELPPFKMKNPLSSLLVSPLCTRISLSPLSLFHVDLLTLLHFPHSESSSKCSPSLILSLPLTALLTPNTNPWTLTPTTPPPTPLLLSSSWVSPFLFYRLPSFLLFIPTLLPTTPPLPAFD